MENKSKVLLSIFGLLAVCATAISFVRYISFQSFDTFVESGQNLTDAITNCEWDSVRYMIFSDNVFEPLIYYSHLGSLFLSIVFGLFIFMHGRKQLLNKTLFATIIFFVVWLFSDLVLWATDNPSYTMFFWTLEILFEPLVYVGALYFFCVFVEQKDVSLKKKSIWFFMLLPTIVLLPTKFALLGFDLTNCDRAATEGILAQYGYLIEIIFVGWIIATAISSYRKVDDVLRKQILFIVTALCLFLLSFSAGNIIEVITENWQIGQIGLLGVPVFIGIITYSIIKFHTFNIKLISSFALISALAALNFSLIFIRDVTTFRAITLVTFLLTILFGVALIKSILREIKQNQAIEQLVKARSEFLTVASHQLRTPVSLITGTLSLMQDGTIDQLPPDQKTKLLEGIFVKSRKLTNIINDILQASEMDIMNFHLSKEAIQPLDLHALLKKIKTDLEEKADTSKITLTYAQVDNDKAVMVSGNNHYLEEALANVVDNAIKYTPKGYVKMELISPEIGTNKVIVKISDSGIGIPLEDQPKMFEKFKRAKNAVNSYADGSGLGLFIVKKIIEAHPGGKIYFISPGEGKGTTFYIELTTI